MGKEVITNKDFYEKFIECLEKGVKFKLKNKIVKGVINIMEIWGRIKYRKLKGATIEQKDNKIIINISIDIHIYNVKFKENFKLSETAYTIRYISRWDENYKIDHKEKGDNHYFKIIFNGKTDFEHITFEGKADFGSAIFKHAKFNHTTFEKDADFKNTISGKLEFDKSTFEDIAYFRDIYFGLLSFVDCTFKSMAEFRKGRIKFKKYEWHNNPNVKRHNKQWAKLISNTIKYGLAIFNNAQFLNKHSKITNFRLSKTSFLKTDVREVMLLCDIKKEKILSHKLLNNDFKNEEIYKKIHELFEDQLKDNSVLAEYRNLRLSVEDNITYEEASNLYKLEMELRKENSKFPEKLAIELYNLISNYGESVEKSVLWIMLAIFLIPLCALSCNYIVSDRLIASIWIIFSILIWYCYTVENLEKLIPHLIILTVVGYIFSYIFIYLSHMPIMELLRDTITAFFQLSIDDAIIEKTGNYEHFMKNWEGIIRIISLILLGNLYITLRRRLSRK